MDEHLQLVEDCMHREERLSDWERTFIDEMAGLLHSDVALMPRQAEKLDEIWDRVTARG